MFATKAAFPKGFGHGTLYNLVNSYGILLFYAPTLITQASEHRKLTVSKRMGFITFFM
jgi:hypothetical protein